MALNFPTSPELNQVYTSGTRSWRWDGSSWVANNSVTNILGYIPVNKAGDTMSGGLNVPNVNAVTVTANSGGFSIAGGSSASKTLTVSNSVTVSGTDGSTLNIGAGGTLQSGAFQASSQGTTGAQGVQGTTGIQGSVGTQGTLGTQGSTGAQGTVGGAGIQGSTGSQGTGGAQGATGSQGAQGVQGTQGRTGAQGSTGTQGAVGSTGGTGATGSTGVQGTTGATGAQGTSGATILGNTNTWTATNTFNNTISGSVNGNAGGYSTYFPPRYDSGVRTNPQDYFGTNIGARVAMTGIPTAWSDTLWVNGYTGGDVPYCNALHFFRGSSPKMWVSTQTTSSTSYGTSYEIPLYGLNNSNTSGLYAGIFYDSGNTGYYVDPASNANIAGYVYSGNSYTYGWFRNEGAQGLYNSSYGNHFYSTSDVYWNIAGNSASTTGLIMRTGGHQGTVRGYLYGDSSNNFGLLSYAGGWVLQMAGGDYMNYYGSSIRSYLYYDLNNTGYYLDPASTSNLYALTANSTFTVNNGWSYLANNYGYGVVGLYNSTIFQLVFAMGDSYKTTAGGGINNLYGIAWSHPNAGGIAGNLDSHGLIVAINGGFGSCMAYSIKASSNVTAYSDERLKKDWADLPKNYVEQLAKVKVGTYTRIDGEKLRQVGVSAQSLKPLLPEAVIEATDDFKTLSVAYGNAAMASAVELAKEVVTLKEQLNIVMERLKQLENK